MSSRRSHWGALVAVPLLAVGCSSSGSSSTGTPRDEQAVILSMMNDARTALLDGEPSKVCSYLTRHGRDRIMEFRVDYDEEGQIAPTDPRLPQTCTAMVQRLYDDAQRPGSGINWPRQLQTARFTVTQVAG